jgi:hypothetical protein
MVDPYRAVTEMLLSNRAEVPTTTMPAHAVDEVAARRDSRWSTMGLIAGSVSIVVCGVLVVAGLMFAMWRRMAKRSQMSLEAPEPDIFGGEDPRMVDLAELYYKAPKPPRAGADR